MDFCAVVHTGDDKPVGSMRLATCSYRIQTLKAAIDCTIKGDEISINLATATGIPTLICLHLGKGVIDADGSIYLALPLLQSVKSVTITPDLEDDCGEVIQIFMGDGLGYVTVKGVPDGEEPELDYTAMLFNTPVDMRPFVTAID